MKKGFTLVELLGVIVILGILAIITTVSVTGVMNGSRSSISSTQKRKIEEAAKAYYIKEGKYNDYDNFFSCVNLSYLISNGYIGAKEVKDAITGNPFNGSVKITYESNRYSYEYNEGICFACTASDGTDEGDAVTCGTEKFYVINNDGSTVTMIAAQNITPVTDTITVPVQSSSAEKIEFMPRYYYTQLTPVTYISENPQRFIYDLNEDLSKTTLYPTLTAYKLYLENAIGMNVSNVRLLNIDEYKANCFENQCDNKLWLKGDNSNQVYFIGYVYDMSLYQIMIMNDNILGTGCSFSSDGITQVSGIRPVIEMSVDNIK